MSSEKRESAPQGPPRGPLGGHGPGRGGPAAMMPGEKAKDFTGAMRMLAAYLKKDLPVIALCFALAVVSVVLMLFGPRVLAGATNLLVQGLAAMVAGAGGIDFAAILRVLLLCGVLYLASAALQYVQGFILITAANRISRQMRSDISRKINRLPLAYYDGVSHGEVLSRVTNDVDTLTQSLTQSLPQLVSSLTSVAGVLVMMFTINVWMTLFTLLMLPLSLGVVMLLVKRSQPYYKKQQGYLGEANGQVEESYGGHLVVRAFGREQESENAFNEVNGRLYTAAWRSQFLGGMMMPLMQFIGNLGYVLVVILGGWFTLRGAITVGDIQAFIQYVRNFTQPIQQIANSSNVLQQTAAAAERIFGFLSEAEETPGAAAPVDAAAVQGSVYFAHVQFGYLPDKTIIHDFSAVVPQGRRVAIVGPTGAGKTTMVKLLMRFYDVNAGAILVDGYDVKQFERNTLRGMFGMVLQDTWLYSDTIMENIRYGRLGASDDEVMAAAKAAQADRFIRTLPNGYATVLNEEATNISAGQKQLLTIARTILSEPKIMILDEATSSVDTRTEVLIQRAMKRLMEGRTSFVIAHRLSTIRDADMILVMRGGDVAEMGTHEELLAKNGFYAQLYNSQFERESAGNE